MRKLAILCVAVLALPALASVYTDATNDIAANIGSFPNLDIAGVEITNDLTNINFQFTIVGDVLATDWGKYMVILDSIPGGDTAGNGWARPIGMASGADYWIGSWIDSGGGAELRRWDGSGWVLDSATYSPPSAIQVPVRTQYTVTLTTTLASLGLAPGDVFQFDAFSSGGGGSDGAVDAVNNPNPQINWWSDYSLATPQSYTVTPEPAALALLALGLLIRRR
jgi:hypothetical protein